MISSAGGIGNEDLASIASSSTMRPPRPRRSANDNGAVVALPGSDGADAEAEADADAALAVVMAMVVGPPRRWTTVYTGALVEGLGMPLRPWLRQQRQGGAPARISPRLMVAPVGMWRVLGAPHRTPMVACCFWGHRTSAGGGGHWRPGWRLDWRPDWRHHWRE